MVKRIILLLVLVLTFIGIQAQSRDFDIYRVTNMKVGGSIGESGTKIDSLQISNDSVYLYSNGTKYTLNSASGGNTSPDSLLINATDTIVFKGDTLYANKVNIQAKTGHFADSIWVNNGWIIGVDKSDNMIIDSTTTNNFSLGGSVYVDTISEISYILSKVTRNTYYNNITSIGLNTSAITVSLTLLDNILIANYTANFGVTLDLPTAQNIKGRTIKVIDTGGSSSTNNITISTEGSETINGSNSYVLNVDYKGITLFSDGINWYAF